MLLAIAESETMNEQKKHTIYTEADIQRYLSGGMSNPEMHAIEKAAMDDPLLAEAMEGYEAMEQKDWGKELAALKDKLDASENTSVAPVYSFRKWWRAAAAVTILTIGVAVAYLFNKSKKEETPAIAQVFATDSVLAAKDDSDAAVNSIAANEAVTNNEVKLPGTAETEASKKATILLAEAKKERSDSSFIYKPSASTTPNYNKDDIAAASNPNEDSPKKESEISDTNKGYNNLSNEVNDKRLPVQNQAGNAAGNFINAQVVTADDKPVAFANVSVQKNRQPVYTDAKGNFKIPATDTAINGVVTSAGYIPKKFSLKNFATENKIILQQDTIHLTTISSAKSKTTAKAELKKNIENADTNEDAEPTIGWDEYNNYISDNLVFPSEAKQKNIHGVVEVFVKLKNNGDISQVKVNKPLCPECDAEAIRLVKDGPKWDVKNNKAKKAKVKIKF